jgi:hypothetical protein
MKHRRTIFGLLLVVVAVVAAGARGDGSGDLPRPPDDVAAYLPFDDAWPDRVGEIIVPVDPTHIRWICTKRSDPDKDALFESARQLVPDNHGSKTPDFKREGGNVWYAYHFGPRPSDVRKPSDPEFLFEYLSGEADGDAIALQRTWFAVYVPEGELGGARGTVLVIPGMYGTPRDVIDPLVEYLLTKDWAVLRMLTHPTRYTERVEFDVDLGDAASMRAAAGDIARLFDDRSAEVAYASRAGFEHLYERHPELTDLPRAAIGMSGGGIALTTVAAQDPDFYDALIYIGAGAVSLRIIETSNYVDGRLSVGLNYIRGEPTADERLAFHHAFLDASPLDGYHTAKALLDVPVLMIQSPQDAAVPAELGDVLWRRLGKPERWKTPGGHEALFMMLPMRFGKMVDWLNDATRADTTPDDAGDRGE